MRITVIRIAGYGPLQCRDSIFYVADLKACQAEIVLDHGIQGLEQRCLAQRRDRIHWPSLAKPRRRQRKQGPHLLRHY
jgi:hypothetical protein